MTAPATDRRGRVITWSPGTMRPRALHEPPPSPWRLADDVVACPLYDCGARLLYVHVEAEKRKCVNGHVLTEEHLHRLAQARLAR